MLPDADIRHAEACVGHELFFDSDIELLETRVLNVEWNRVGGDALEALRAACERSDATWIDSAWKAGSASFCYALVEGVGCDRVANSLCGRRWIENSGPRREGLSPPSGATPHLRAVRNYSCQF